MTRLAGVQGERPLGRDRTWSHSPIYAAAVAPSESSHARVPARVGLAGNPSDGFDGAVLAAVVDELAAEITVTPTDAPVRIRSGALAPLEWSSPLEFVADVGARGHATTEHRVVTAALIVLARHLGGAPPCVDIDWSSDIPRSVGLAGSSAIAVGVIEAVAASGGTRLDPRVIAALALAAETTELGIAAGWQDRIVQAHRRTVLVDASELSSIDRCLVPAVRTFARTDVEAVIGWCAADAEDSDTYHADLRKRASATDVAGAMDDLADLARRAADAIDRGDRAALMHLVDASWTTRRRVMPLRADHDSLVETARDAGVAATSPGSGGSVVAIPADAIERDTVVDALRAFGATTLTVRLR